MEGDKEEAEKGRDRGIHHKLLASTSYMKSRLKAFLKFYPATEGINTEC